MSEVSWISTVNCENDPHLAVIVDDIISRNDGDACISTVTYNILKDVQSPYCIDIGVDKGWWTFFVKKYFPESTVHGFEPNPISYAKLIKRIRTTGVKNIFFHHFAVSNTIGLLKLHLNGGDSHTRDVKEGVVVPCHPIDQFISETPVDFMKIDTEGHEQQVLKSILPFSKTIKNIIFEFSIFWYGANEEEQLEAGKKLLNNCYENYPFMYSLGRREIALKEIQKDSIDSFCEYCIKNHYQCDIFLTHQKYIEVV